MTTAGGAAWRATGALRRSTVLGAGGLALGVGFGRPAVLVLTVPLLLMSLMAMVRRPTTRPLVETSLPHASLREGEGVALDVRIHDDADVEQITRVLTPQRLVLGRPDEGRVVAWWPDAEQVEVSPRRWGVITVSERVALTSAWAGYRWGPVVPADRPLTVLPMAPPYDSRAEQPRPKGLVGAHRSSQQGQGSELAGIRPFQPGDRLRRINWRVSARTGTLHTTTTRAEQDAGLLLVVDLLAEHGASGGLDGATSSLDLTVRAAAALAEHAAAQGDRVALRPVGGRARPVPPGVGRRHLRRVLGTLTDIRPGASPYDDLTRIDLRVGAGTTVILLSPLLADAIGTTAATLTRRGIPTVVIDTLPDGVVPDLPDRQAVLVDLAWRMRLLDRGRVLSALDAIGCPVVPWRGRGTVDDVMRDLGRRVEPTASASVIAVLRRLAGLREWPASALLLRAVMVLAPIAAVLTATGAGGAPPPSVVAVVVLFSVGFAVAPESGMGLLALGSVIGWWCLVEGDGLDASVLVAAVLLTLAHVAGLVASYSPPGMRVVPAIGSVWLARGAIVLLSAPAVWLVARLVRDSEPVAALWQSGLAVALLTVVVAGVVLGRDRRSESAPTRPAR